MVFIFIPDERQQHKRWRHRAHLDQLQPQPLDSRRSRSKVWDPTRLFLFPIEIL